MTYRQSGKGSNFSLAFRNKLNKLSNVKNAAPGYSGEMHLFSIVKNRNGKKRLVSNSNNGPRTNVVQGLKDGRKPVSLGDKVGYAHDLRFALAKNTRDLRRADNIYKGTMRKLRNTGMDSTFNTLPGEKGIALKNKLEDTGILSRKTFLSPMKDKEGIRLAKKELSRLEQEGYGTTLALQTGRPSGIREKLPLPGEPMIRKHRRKLKNQYKKRGGSKGRRALGRSKAKFGTIFTKKILPPIIKELRKVRGLKFVKSGKGLRSDIDKMERKLNSGSGVIATTALLAPIAIPLGIQAVKLAIPLLKKLFKKIKRKGRGLKMAGNGLGDFVVGTTAKLMRKIMLGIIKEFLRAAAKKSGSGLKSVIKKAAKKFSTVIRTILEKGTPAAIKTAKILFPIARDIGVPVLTDIVFPIISKKIG